jgi:integrator complex subunit 6
MLVTCGEQGVPYKDNDTNHFLNIVKNLEANDLTEIGVALKKSFDLLNMTRLHDGTDSYGTGRNPHLSQPSMIILVTDGAKLTSLTGIMDTVCCCQRSFLIKHSLRYQTHKLTHHF